MLQELGANVIGVSLPPISGSLYESIGSTSVSKSIYADIRDANNLKKIVSATKPDGIFHLAAQPLVLPSYEMPIETFETNFNGTLNLLEAMRTQQNLAFAIMVTTDKVYRNDENGNDFVESDPLGGEDPYSASKAAAEIVISAMRASFFKEELVKIVSVRAGNVIGGGDISPYRLFPDLIQSFKAGETCEIRNPKSVRPWQHVFDPIYGYLLVANAVMQNLSVSNSYNFGPSIENIMSVGEVAEFTQKIWSEKAEIEFLESAIQLKEAHLLGLNSNLAKEELGWENMLSVKETIALAVEWERFKLNNPTPARILRFTQNQIRDYFTAVN
jgi:CDP-glucose 4,6-dehydratase